MEIDWVAPTQNFLFFIFNKNNIEEFEVEAQFFFTSKTNNFIVLIAVKNKGNEVFYGAFHLFFAFLLGVYRLSIIFRRQQKNDFHFFNVNKNKWLGCWVLRYICIIFHFISIEYNHFPCFWRWQAEKC